MQAILNRAVAIAQIPITQLQNRDSDVIQQQTLMAGLQTAVANLADTVTTLGNVAQSQALTATSSNPAAVSVAATGATQAGAYTINSITSPATAASERSLNPVADSVNTPVSSTGTVNLVVGSNNYKFTLTNNSLVGLRDQINSLGAGVTASILTTSGGNYLSISSNTTGASTLQLFDDPDGANTSMLTNTNQGTNADFFLNGIEVKQPGNVVNSVISGVTFTIQAASTTPVTLTLASDGTQLSSALQNVISDYNSLSTLLQAQVGPAAGLLSGNSVINQLQSLQRQFTSYTGTTGSIKSLADLGVEFSSTGVASLNTDTFNKLSSTQIADAFSYVGSTTTGLAGFAATLQEFSDPVTGVMKDEMDGLTNTDKDLTNNIATLTDRANLMQSNLQLQLAAADSTLADLESTQNTLTASLQGLSLVLYGQNQNIA
jgi:flagellar hook-associated protein 2